MLLLMITIDNSGKIALPSFLSFECGTTTDPFLVVIKFNIKYNLKEYFNAFAFSMLPFHLRTIQNGFKDPE